MEDGSSLVKDMRNASISVLLDTARDVVEEKIHHSTLLQSTNIDMMPVFGLRDLKLGRVIGRGAFCVVQEVKFRSGAGSVSEDSGSGGQRRRRGLSRRLSSRDVRDNSTNGTCSIGTDGDWASASAHGLNADESAGKIIDSTAAITVREKGQKLVLKKLSPADSNKMYWLKGAVDLAMEARYLSCLSHKNIIKLNGISAADPCTENYFIVLERMEDILAKRIKQWSDTERQCTGITGMFVGNKKKLANIQFEQTQAALDVAQGTSYLHSKKVIFRDLKPDNVGFDGKGTLKLFDFGLAKELREDERSGDCYKMTGFTGAIRYMSPEVGLGFPYNLKSDVYSWSMLYWYILSLEPPFAIYNKHMMEERVFSHGHRPKINNRWSRRVAGLLKQAWAPDQKDRPTMAEVAEVMIAEQEEIKRGK
eukprot:Nitzschia sp. Nitz4//scaffold150_size53981//35302//36646//NITZ4_006681-RA/size53981-snap-gene-0.71-mRNA-1//-1//CDS//3329537083//6576//frame0